MVKRNSVLGELMSIEPLGNGKSNVIVKINNKRISKEVSGKEALSLERAAKRRRNKTLKVDLNSRTGKIARIYSTFSRA